MKNILKVLALVLLAVFNSCDNKDDVGVNYPDIKGLKDNVSLTINQSQSFELSGGNDKFEAKTDNENVVAVSLKGNTLVVTGKMEGTAKVTVTSADKVKVVVVKVMASPITIKGLEDNVSLIVGQNKSFELSGGNNKFDVKSNNSDIVDAKITDMMLSVMAKAVGTAELTVTSSTETKVITVKVMGVPEAGVYMAEQEKVALKHSVKDSKGMWLLKLAGNPYSAERLYIPNLDNNLQEGQSVNLMLKAFQIDGLQSGSQNAKVELVTEDVYKFKVGEYSIIVPRK